MKFNKCAFVSVVSSSALLLSAANALSSQPYSFQVRFDDGIPFQSAVACVGEGCAAQYVAQGISYPGPVWSSDSSGAVTVYAEPGQKIEFVYAAAYAAINQNQGSTWERLTSGSVQNQIVFHHMLSPGSHPAMSKSESYFVDLVNQARSQNGLSSVEAIQALGTLADVQSTWQANNPPSVYNHYGQYGWSPYARAVDSGFADPHSVGEIAGRRSSVYDIFSAFMASPVHRAAILNPDYRYIGVGNISDEWVAELSSSCSSRCDLAVFDPNTPDVPQAGSVSVPVPLLEPSSIGVARPVLESSPVSSKRPSISCFPKLIKVTARKVKKKRAKITVKASCFKKSSRLIVQVGRSTKYYKLKKNSVTIKASGKKIKVGVRQSGVSYSVHTIRIR